MGDAAGLAALIQPGLGKLVRAPDSTLVQEIDLGFVQAAAARVTASFCRSACIEVSWHEIAIAGLPDIARASMVNRSARTLARANCLIIRRVSLAAGEC